MDSCWCRPATSQRIEGMPVRSGRARFGRMVRVAAAATAGAGAAMLGGCGTGDVDAAGLGDPAAVIACSEAAFWGTVESTDHQDGAYLVTFAVREWVHPSSGPPRITLEADDPAEQVGAPQWTPAERVFVRDGQTSPLDRLSVEDAEQIVAAWRGSRPKPACPDHP